MTDIETKVFPPDFLLALKTFVNVHHSIYRNIPPQGIYFEALVLEAFTQIKKPFTPIEPTARNLPANDLLVEDTKISIKTETGAGTKPNRITITKLCTTEKEPWKPDVLIEQEESRAQGARCIIIVCNYAAYHFDAVHPIHPE